MGGASGGMPLALKWLHGPFQLRLLSSRLSGCTGLVVSVESGFLRDCASMHFVADGQREKPLLGAKAHDSDVERELWSATAVAAAVATAFFRGDCSRTISSVGKRESD